MENKGFYRLWSVIFFITEVLIASFFNDSFIRPFFGDFIVVLLLYCMLKSVINLKVNTAAIVVLLFSFIIEFFQYVDILNLLGLEHTRLTRLVLGTSFHWNDIIAYTLGFIAILILEHQFLNKRQIKNGNK
jgi:uncharacterized protein DUF2809